MKALAKSNDADLHRTGLVVPVTVGEAGQEIMPRSKLKTRTDTR